MNCKNVCIYTGSFMLIIILFGLSFIGLGLGIASLVIGIKWEDCHLNDLDVDIYLIVIGSLQIAGFICQLIWGKKNNDTGDTNFSNLIGLAVVGVLIWGMTIFWGSEQGDCRKGQYDYGYYMTIILMFFIIVLISLIFITSIIRIALM